MCQGNGASKFVDTFASPKKLSCGLGLSMRIMDTGDLSETVAKRNGAFREWRNGLSVEGARSVSRPCVRGREPPRPVLSLGG